MQSLPPAFVRSLIAGLMPRFVSVATIPYQEYGCMCRVCTAAFAQAMLAGETQPGVWFPEEREALQNRKALLQSSAEGCVRFELNRPPWALESAPRRLGFGIYID